MSLRTERAHPQAAAAVRAEAKKPAKYDLSQGVTKDTRFSQDFRSWLMANGYGKYKFASGPLPSFGGRSSPGDKLKNDPVIFIHGNADTAAGWDKSVEYFKAHGYSESELYGMTWGPGDPMQAWAQTHSKEYEQEVRAFIQAVKDYTGAKKVDIVAHSMGVTLARKALKGGEGYDPLAGSYNLGNPLTDEVDTFVGISGANHGLPSTMGGVGQWVPTTNPVNGLGWDSQFTQELNDEKHYEGSHVYSIWSEADELIGVGMGGLTAPIPGQDGQHVYWTYPFGHLGSRDLTADVQLEMVKDHKTN